MHRRDARHPARRPRRRTPLRGALPVLATAALAATVALLAVTPGVDLATLLVAEPPDERTAYELELRRAQESSLYTALGLPAVKPTKGTPTETLAALVGLHRELARQASKAIATPEEARRANTELREWMRGRDNYLPEIERLAEEQVKASGHVSGALTHREVSVMAEQLGLRKIMEDTFKTLWWVPSNSPPELVHGYMRALKRAEQALESDLQKYLPLWKLAIPPDFENVHAWDFSRFGRGERYIDEPLPEEDFGSVFQQVQRWKLDDFLKEKRPEQLSYPAA